MTHTLASETLHTPMVVWVEYISIEMKITETNTYKKIFTPLTVKFPQEWVHQLDFYPK